MLYEVDEYILERIEDEDKYYIAFKDSVKNDCKLEINKEIFDIYIKSKANYIKIKNETRRHIEQLTLTEEEIYNRAFNCYEDVEEKVIKNIEKRELSKGMETLTKTQARRMELHIIDKVTIRDLAKLENVNKNQIEKSIKLGFKKLKKFFEK